MTTNRNSAQHSILGSISATNPSSINAGTISTGIVTISGNSLKSQGIFETAISGLNSSCVEKTYYESIEDSLIVSCVWHRLRNSNTNSKNFPFLIGKIQNQELYNNITTADRTHAAKIRDFYQKRFMIWKLKDKRLSKFRQDLEKYINSDGKLYPNDYSGMIYRLPEFYEYDLTVTEIKEENFDVNVKINNCVNEKKLKPVKKLSRTTRSMKRVNYWFSDNNNSGVLFSIESSNILLNVFDQIFNSHAEISVKGTYQVSDKEDFDHYVLSKIQSINY